MGTASQASAIRHFIIQNVAEHPRDIAAVTADVFGVTPRAVNHHLRNMVAEDVLWAEGKTRARRYGLAAQKQEWVISLDRPIEEHVLWREEVAPLLQNLSENVYGICNHGFTEMVNNVIDHSEGNQCRITVVRSAASVEIWIVDDGVGIFRKIKEALDLRFESDALLELIKGKVTTDPSRHTGEGIFFTSRMFDKFGILSGEIFFCHLPDDSDWVVEQVSKRKGTTVQMAIDVSTDRTTSEVFDRFAKPDEFAFTVTNVPVALVKHGEENLVSRSQAKRLVNRFERFEDVILDFTGVKSIGQAFADEVFRVFQLAHPNVTIQWVNATPEVERMISRARHALRESLEAAGR